MIKRFLLVLIILFPLSGRAQENEDIKLGLALPIFSKTNKNVSISSGPIFSIEKPFSVDLFSKNSFGINPGLAYFKFFENEQPQELGNGISKDLKHGSFNVFIKAFYNLKINKLTNSYIYMGGITGFHLATSSKGAIEIYIDGKKEHSLSKDINESGKSFFNSVYYGFLLGFHPKSKSENIVTPSFELSYLPNFVSLKNNQEHALQISIFLGLNQKKKATQNE